MIPANGMSRLANSSACVVETSCLEDVDGKPIPNFFEKWQHELALQDAKPCDLRAELASVKPIPANQLQDQCAWIVTALEDFRNRVQDITHRVHEYEAGFTDLEECFGDSSDSYEMWMR